MDHAFKRVLAGVPEVVLDAGTVGPIDGIAGFQTKEFFELKSRFAQFFLGGLFVAVHERGAGPIRVQGRQVTPHFEVFGEDLHQFRAERQAFRINLGRFSRFIEPPQNDAIQIQAPQE